MSETQKHDNQICHRCGEEFHEFWTIRTPEHILKICEDCWDGFWEWWDNE